MKAIVLNEIGGPEKLLYQEVPEPTAGELEVVVELKAAALNRRDVWIRKGQYANIVLPAILGSDGAGLLAGTDRKVIINPSLDWGPSPLAQQKSFRILGLPDHGTYASFVTVPAINVEPMPEGFSFEEAAALPLAALTAYRALVTRAQLRSGETVLVSGIGGGVSVFALQIAIALGARVFVTSGSEEKLERAHKLGAAGGVNYRSATWAKDLVKLTGGEGADVAIDSAGGESFAQAIEALKPGGRIVNYGATTGSVPEFALRRVFWKQITILGSTMGTIDEFRAMLELFGSHAIKPVIDTVFPLGETAAAHQRMERAEQFGKIVLRTE